MEREKHGTLDLPNHGPEPQSSALASLRAPPFAGGGRGKIFIVLGKALSAWSLKE